MKTALIPTLLAALSLCAADAPVSLWRFDGSLADEAGQSRDGLAPGGNSPKARFVTAEDVPGVSGKAVALGVEKGDAEYFTTPSSADVRLGSSYTIEAWIHPTRISAWNRLVLNWGKGHAYHLATHNGVASLYHGQADEAYLCAEGGRIRAGRWYHLAGVARRNDANPAESSLEVYVNGRRTASARFDGTIRALPDEGLGVGDDARGSGGPAMRFRGYLDHLAVWNRALEPAEIKAHYDERAEAIEKLAAAEKKAEAARRAKQLAELRDLGVTEIVFAERHAGRDPSGHYYANFGYSCIDPEYWIHGADGGRLVKLNVSSGAITALVDDPEGAVRDPQVHYEARKVLFSYRKGGTHHYNLYEIGTDGKDLRRLTDGPWDDIEPTYLPDGGIIFCSSRCKRYIGCWLAQSATLFRCDADGGNIRMLSSGTFTENTPAVLPDGRVLYTRWEYVNRDPVVFHHLWTMNPDGTSQAAFFGNMHPGGVFIDAKPIPGTDRVVFIYSPGHGRNEHVGRVATVTGRLGPDERAAILPVSPGGDFRDPYPITENAFLAARGNSVVLLTADRQVRPLYTSSMMVHEPCLVRERPREMVSASKADLSKDFAVLAVNDVYAGRAMQGVKRGTIKKLLVLEDLPKPANFHGGGSQPIGHGVTSTLKRILGTVPVEADGSACFKVPPLRSIYLALLDENDMSVKQMRSFVTLQPGEVQACVGCHEQRTTSPAVRNASRLQAMARTPTGIEPIPDVPPIPEFPRDVQPILDKHCLKCHSHEARKGGVVLSGDRGPVYSHSYYTLLLHWQIKDTAQNPVNETGRQKGNDAPYACFSSASPLMKKIDGSHHDVTLSAREKRIVRCWIDVCAQYPGTYAAYGTGQVGGCWGNNKPVRVMADDWPSTAPAREAIQRRCVSCHGKMLPKHVTDLVPLSHGDMLSWRRPMSRFSRHRIYNLTNPEKSLILMAPLAKEAGGYAVGKAKVTAVREDRNRPPKPVTHHVVFSDTSDPDYLKIVTHIRAAKAKLDEIKRFDMPGFRPNEHYVREMKRFGVLPATFDLAKDDIDAYATDQRYWESMWHDSSRSGEWASTPDRE